MTAVVAVVSVANLWALSALVAAARAVLHRAVGIATSPAIVLPVAILAPGTVLAVVAMPPASASAVVAVAVVAVAAVVVRGGSRRGAAGRRIVVAGVDYGHRADAEQPQQSQTNDKFLHIASLSCFYLL